MRTRRKSPSRVGERRLRGKSVRSLRRELPLLTNRIRGLLKGSRLSTEAVLEAYETSLVDAGLGD